MAAFHMLRSSLRSGKEKPLRGKTKAVINDRTPDKQMKAVMNDRTQG